METMVNIGAVDFLSHLRRDVDPSLYRYIDSVLTNLLSLPEVVDIDDEQLHYDGGKQASASDGNAKFSHEVLKEHEKRGTCIPDQEFGTTWNGIEFCHGERLSLHGELCNFVL